MNPFASNALRLFGRALRLRCPNCGQRKLFESWLRTRIAAELLFAFLFAAIVVFTWPSPPWTLLEYGGIATMVIAPFVFYPFSKALFLAFDLLFRPPAPEDMTRSAGDLPRP